MSKRPRRKTRGRNVRLTVRLVKAMRRFIHNPIRRKIRESSFAERVIPPCGEAGSSTAPRRPKETAYGEFLRCGSPGLHKRQLRIFTPPWPGIHYVWLQQRKPSGRQPTKALSPA